MSFTYTCCYYVSDSYSGGSEWNDEGFDTFSECLTHVLKVLKNPADFETPEEGITVDEDYWYSSDLRLERGLYVCNDNHQSFRSGPDHEQSVPLPLAKGDDGSAYGWPEHTVRQDRWTLAVHHAGKDYYASHGTYPSLSIGEFQVHARQKAEENSTAQWYLISAFAPGAGGFGNNPAALVPGPLCIKGDASEYGRSRSSSLLFKRMYPQY